VHLVLAPLYEADSAYCIAEIMQGIKSSSAHQINRLLNRVWPGLQRESFDHVLRREEGIAAKVEYIISEPCARGLGERSGGVQVDLGGLSRRERHRSCLAKEYF